MNYSQTASYKVEYDREIKKWEVVGENDEWSFYILKSLRGRKKNEAFVRKILPAWENATEYMRNITRALISLHRAVELPEIVDQYFLDNSLPNDLRRWYDSHKKSLLDRAKTAEDYSTKYYGADMRASQMRHDIQAGKKIDAKPPDDDLRLIEIGDQYRSDNTQVHAVINEIESILTARDRRAEQRIEDYFNGDASALPYFLGAWSVVTGYKRAGVSGRMAAAKMRLIADVKNLAADYGWNYGYGFDPHGRNMRWVMYVDSPEGQLSWHVDDDDVEMRILSEAERVEMKGQWKEMSSAFDTTRIRIESLEKKLHAQLNEVMILYGKRTVPRRDDSWSSEEARFLNEFLNASIDSISYPVGRKLRQEIDGIEDALTTEKGAREALLERLRPIERILNRGYVPIRPYDKPWDGIRGATPLRLLTLLGFEPELKFSRRWLHSESRPNPY
ncbi:MAG: hypothetical protein Q8O94_02950 [bacterium]|nr:hypothetical protein [bacterium]